MRKELLGTTALVAAGLFVGAGAGEKAHAADPLELSVGGFYQTALSVLDFDEFAANRRDHTVSVDGELQFRASTTLDNGVEVGARIEIEAFNGANQIDENYLWFEGGFGQIQIGNNDNVAYSMHYQAPVADWYQSLNTASFGSIAPTVGNIAFTLSTYSVLGFDGEKVIYFTPRINGFQLGVSYQPDSRTAQTGPFFTPPADNNTNRDAEIWAVSGNFVQTVGEMDLSLSLGFVGARNEGGLGPDKDDISFGFNVGFGNITVGASLLKEMDYSVVKGGAGLSNLDRDSVDVGVTYATGPWTLGFEFFHVEAEEATGPDDEVDAVSVGAAYNIGPGVDFHAAFKYGEYTADAGDTGIASATATDPKGWLIVVGPSVSF